MIVSNPVNRVSNRSQNNVTYDIYILIVSKGANQFCDESFMQLMGDMANLNFTQETN